MTLTHSGASELSQLMEGTTAGALIPEIVRRGFQDLLEAEVSAAIGAQLHERRPATQGPVSSSTAIISLYRSQTCKQGWMTDLLVHLHNNQPNRPTDQLRIVVLSLPHPALETGETPSMLVEPTQTCSTDDDEPAL